MAEKKNVVTYSGLKKIEEELQNLKVNKRREIAAKIKEAREQGDLSENAEYDAAKDEQRDIEARIEQLEAMLKNIEVVDEDEVDTGVVGIGCKVVVYDYEFDEKNFCLRGRATHHCYNLGDAVKIQVARADLFRKQLDYKLVRE